MDVLRHNSRATVLSSGQNGELNHYRKGVYGVSRSSGFLQSDERRCYRADISNLESFDEQEPRILNQ